PLYLVSDHLHELESSDHPLPEKATLLGACKVIPQEYPNITCRSLEVTLPQQGTRQAERVVQQLLAEFAAPSIERTIAFRGRHRFVQSFEHLQVDTSIKRPTLLREQGTYLVIGGFGTKGHVIAESLAKTVQAKLVLTTRQEFPPRAEWDRLLQEQGNPQSLVDRIRFVQSLEASGAEVLVLTANVADELHMQTALQTAESHFGTLHGIIHAAGEMDLDTLTTISDTGPAESALHFQARVQGLYVLENLLQERDLDFCLLVSSIASVLGGIGFSAPAAAHQFMDAFAHLQNRESDTPWMTVNWDRMDAAEMLDLVPHVFSQDDHTQVVISKPELQDSLNRWVLFTDASSATDSAADGKGSVSIIHQRPNLNNPYVEPTNDMEQAVAEILQDLLGIEQVGIHDNFFQLGGNSLLGTQVVTRIRNTFQIDLPLRALFDANTVAQMAVLVEEILIAELESLDDEEVERLSSI
ncbi:MAG: KR domain-containing protein, partial [Tumebacillaceae bacterium]